MFMKKYLLLCLSILTVAGVGVVLSSCESDDPPPNPKVNFARATRTLAENAGTLEVEVTLDRAIDKDVIIGYEIDGSAVEGTDYEIPVDIGEVEIPAGSTTGVFEIVLTNDALYEGNETIELRIDDAPSNVDLGEEDEMIITITEDDAQPVVSFTETTFAINEDDGGYDLEVSLSAASGQDVTVNYTIDGDAIDSVYGSESQIPPQFWDYYINGESGTVVIPAGETTAVIEIRSWIDFIYEGEDPEVMVFELSGADGATVTSVAAKKEATGTLAQQDGRGVELYWGDSKANLNLFMWDETSVANFTTVDINDLWGFSTWAQADGDPQDELFEAVFLPTIMGELTPTRDAFGVSVLYKTGTVSLDFELLHFDFADGAVEDEAGWTSHIGTYTTANLNNFPTASNTFPKVIQTFERVSGQYTEPTGITEPVAGSRVDNSSSSKYPLRTVDPRRVRPISRLQLLNLQSRLKRGDLNIRSVKK
jgi:hypothetical protein